MSSFDDFYNLYDNKKSRDKCEKIWYRLSAKDQLACMDSLPLYIKNTPDRAFRKHPTTYLNQKCWNDVIYGEEKEKKEIYRTPEQKPVSDYIAFKPTQEVLDDFIVGKIKDAYEGKIYLRDNGSVYTNRLKDFLSTPESIINQIEKEVESISDPKPYKEIEHEGVKYQIKQKEEVIEYNHDLEVRNRILRYNMKVWQSEQREIYKEL